MCCGLDENLGMPALRPQGQGSDLYVSAGGRGLARGASQPEHESLGVTRLGRASRVACRSAACGAARGGRGHGRVIGIHVTQPRLVGTCMCAA